MLPDNLIEIWKDIPGFEGLYQISDKGRIKSLSRIIKQKNRSIKWPERILNCSKSRGYHGVKLYNGLILRSFRVHRLVAITFIDNPLILPEVNHLNGVKDDNRLENLEWCNRSRNVKHAYDNKLIIPRFGDSSHSSKLSSFQVVEIRKLYKNKIYTQMQLAEMYNTKVSNINMIITNKTWKREQFQVI